MSLGGCAGVLCCWRTDFHHSSVFQNKFFKQLIWKPEEVRILTVYLWSLCLLWQLLYCGSIVAIISSLCVFKQLWMKVEDSLKVEVSVGWIEPCGYVLKEDVSDKIGEPQLKQFGFVAFGQCRHTVLSLTTGTGKPKLPRPLVSSCSISGRCSADHKMCSVVKTLYYPRLTKFLYYVMYEVKEIQLQ